MTEFPQDENVVKQVSSEEMVSPLNFSIEKRSGIKLEKFGREQAYDSVALFQNGTLVDDEYLKDLPPSRLVQAVLEASSLIEAGDSVKAFSEGRLDIDLAIGAEEVLAFQYQDMLRALDEIAFSGQFSIEDVGTLLDYAYELDTPKPFAEGISSVLFNAVLPLQRELLYKAMKPRERSLAEASSIVDRLPYGGVFLLDKEPTLAELEQFFTQTEDEAEKNLVIDQAGRHFLVKGMNKDRGVITYREFPDLVADFHTHRIDYPFSTGDIGTYKSLGASRDIYSITSDEVHFFVCTPSGIFEFDGDLEENVFDKQDRKTDSLTIPCTVIDEDTGDEEDFEVYTNHSRGEAGRYIQTLMQRQPDSLRVDLGNGDTIRFTSWRKMKKDGLSGSGIDSLMAKDGE